MLTRRKFIGTLAAGTAGLSFTNPVSALAAGRHQLKDFGYISGIIGKELKNGDWKDVLRKTAEMGYTEIETGRYLGDSAESFLSFCKSINLIPVAGGIKTTKDKDVLNKALDELNALDLKYAVMYWPWLVSAPFSLEDCKNSVDILNTAGEVCKQHGLQLCWHNHNNEFIEMEEGLPFDYLMNNTDKDTVKCEMDVYWVKKGGANIVDMMEKYDGRYSILHIKDMAPGPAQDFECVGSGIVDFPAIFREAQKQGIEHFFVERDKVPDGMACLASAAEYLKNVRY